MRSKTRAELLVDWWIDASFSRPRVSNDNPYSESLFKTAKFAPTFPECFTGIAHGRAFVEPFVAHHNHHHRHTGIGLMTPAAVHQGDAPRITAERARTLQSAFDHNRLRFKGRTPKPPRVPDVVYINPPPSKEPNTQPPVAKNTH